MAAEANPVPSLWSVCLANLPRKELFHPFEEHELNPALNSNRVLRLSILPDGERKTRVGEFCRTAMELKCDWLVLLARRYLTQPMERVPVRYRVNYGGGYETLVLLDGADVPTLQEWELSTKIVCVDVVVAHRKSEKTQQLSDERPVEYGVIADTFEGASSKS